MIVVQPTGCRCVTPSVRGDSAALRVPLSYSAENGGSRLLQKIFNAYRAAFAGLSPEVWLLSLALLINRAGTMVFPLLVLYLTEEKGFTVIQAGIMLSLWGVGEIVGAALGGRLTSEIGAIRIQVISYVLTAAGFLAIPFFSGYLSIAAVLLFTCTAGAMFRPACNTAITEYSPPHLHARAIALNRLAINLGVSIGPVVGGFLASIDFVWLFVIDAATCFGAAVFLAWAFRGARSAVPPSDEPPGSPAASAPTNGSPWLDWRYVAYMLLLTVTAIVFFQLVGTFMLYMTDFYRLEKWQIGLVLSINPVLIVVFEMVLINYVQKYNLLRTVGWGCFLSCISFGLMPLSNHVGYLLFLVVIWSIGEMLAMPLGPVYAARRSTMANRGSTLR